jgi:hypothetical protein
MTMDIVRYRSVDVNVDVDVDVDVDANIFMFTMCGANYRSRLLIPVA